MANSALITALIIIVLALVFTLVIFAKRIKELTKTTYDYSKLIKELEAQKAIAVSKVKSRERKVESNALNMKKLRVHFKTLDVKSLDNVKSLVDEIKKDITSSQHVSVYSPRSLQQRSSVADAFYSESALDSREKTEVETHTIWSEAPLEISFSYEDFNGDKSRRTILLNEVLSNKFGDYYFKGYCLDRDDTRQFKLDRVKSKILYENHRYSLDDFIYDVLDIDTEGLT